MSQQNQFFDIAYRHLLLKSPNPIIIIIIIIIILLPESPSFYHDVADFAMIFEVSTDISTDYPFFVAWNPRFFSHSAPTRQRFAALHREDRFRSSASCREVVQMLQRLADERTKNNGVAATVEVWRFPSRPWTKDSYPYQWRFIAGKIIYFYGPSIPWLC